MKKYFLFVLLIFYSVGYAQLNNQVLISGSTNDPVMNPVFSPDGGKIGYTKAGYKGIWVYDLSTKSSKQISDEDAAGFAFKWSNDSKSILSRVAKYEDMKRLNAVKIFNIDSNESLQLTDYRTRMEYLPEWSDDDSKVILPTKESYETFSSGKPKLLYKNNNDKNVLLKYDKIVTQDISKNEFKNLKPFEDAEYINLSLSPDRSKVLFKVVGGNMFVMNPDGTNLTDLGNGNQPRWSFDSKKIIYVIAEDNGDDYTASDIYMINADGTNKRNLTNTKDLIEMNPCLSADGKNLVYDVYNIGSIYLKNIELGDK
jgi:Tol biopolymer transport system component